MEKLNSWDVNYKARETLNRAAPDLYKCLAEATTEMCGIYSCGGNCEPVEIEQECPRPDGSCFVQKWKKALRKALGEK